MRLLLDQNLSFKLCGQLANLFPGSTQARLVSVNRADDRTLWDHATRIDFLLVTQSADFADMAAVYGPPPKVFWLRGGNRLAVAVAVEGALRRNADLIRSLVEDGEVVCCKLH